MNVIISYVKQHALAAFVILTFAAFWVLLPLAAFSPALPVFIGTFMPALAALLVCGITEGRSGVKNLLSRLTIWQVGILWYAAALGIPVLVGLLSLFFAVTLGSADAANLGAVSLFTASFFLFAIGEELGWRGFALPRLLEQFSPFVASLLLGAIWFAWHLPLFLPGMMFDGVPLLPAGLVFLVISILYTWIFQHTNGSVLLAILLHGSSNATGIFYVGMDLAQGRWLQAAAYGVIALVVVLVSGPGLVRQRPAQSELSRASQSAVSK